MLHEKRIWGEPVMPASLVELAEKLVDYTWTCCTAWRADERTLLLNDSTSPDRIQEYAILRLIEGRWFQVESITFGWCDHEKALKYIEASVGGVYDHLNPFKHEFEARFHASDEHCGHCA